MKPVNVPDAFNRVGNSVSATFDGIAGLKLSLSTVAIVERSKSPTETEPP
jgi:hypothetical protein